MPLIPNTRGRQIRSWGLIAVLCSLSVLAIGAQTPVARFTTLAVSRIPAAPGAGTTPLNITIVRWATAEEQAALTTTLLEKDEKGLRELIRKFPRMGAVAPFGSTGVDVRYAYSAKDASGVERIMLLTDRPTSFAEHWYGSRSLDYPYMLINLEMGPSGTGEGTLSVAARLMMDRFNKTLVIENYDLEPLALLNLKRLN